MFRELGLVSWNNNANVYQQVKDEAFESHYMCNLKESLQRARRECPILTGLQFYLSPSVRPSYLDLEEMITNAGGTVVRDIFPLAMYMESFADERKTVISWLLNLKESIALVFQKLTTF